MVKIYAFEVNGFGNHHLMDDANVEFACDAHLVRSITE